MTIKWAGVIKVKKKVGTETPLTFTPNVMMNTALHRVGESYGVKKLLRMHRTGRLMGADMTRCASFALLLLVALLTACSKAPDGQVAQSATKAIDYDRNVGWLHGNCLAIMNSGLPVGTPLTVVQPDHLQRVSSATLAGNANSGETCKALLEDRRKVNADSGYTFTGSTQSLKSISASRCLEQATESKTTASVTAARPRVLPLR